MPPFVGRKRVSTSPPPTALQPRSKRARLTDALDAETPPSFAKTRTFSLGSDSDSSLSDIDSDEFEDVAVKRQTTGRTKALQQDPEEDDEDEDEDVEWEDAGGQAEKETQRPIRDLQITLRKDDDGPDYGSAARAANGKKGPSKREKLARVQTHQLHVQFLLWHNAIRNSWISDKKVQDILVSQMPSQLVREVDKWRRASGLTVPQTPSKSSTKGKKSKRKTHDPRAQRDWGRPSSQAEQGKADMSNGDPLISLMKVLSAYWKKRFAITAPGLRKRGYGTKQGLKQDIASYRNDEHDPRKHGERIRHINEFREVARKCEGSRDVGAQLFTALLRGLGIEARLVASLQPAGFGWTKAEQMIPRKPSNVEHTKPLSEVDDTESDEEDPPPQPKASKPSTKTSSSTKTRSKPLQKADSKRTGRKEAPIDLDSDKEEKEDDGDEDNVSMKDDASVIDVTPSLPKARPARFDRELLFPIYWTEAISPVTQKVLPVSPLVLASPVASTPEVLATFEPRGAKADKALLVIAYVVAYSADGTAKDVTVRYLRKRLWPGKTKQFRYPVERVPIYDKRGRIKKYENYDWFKHIMMNYTRSDDKRTAVDDLEDATDLIPAEAEKKKEADVDTLQSLKSSADFCLERFLRREEALKPGAEPVRTFVSGKGDNLREDPVYRRSDVERCLTAESWHKEGRRPKAGETALKLVPVRAVTLARKREAEEHQMRTGEKQMQGLYSQDQTEWIIPPPIKNGVIPKNSYGNIDCFVPSMVPKGAVHVPLRGTVRLCKKLEIDYAEAVVGFEFGNKMAVPVINGVVIAAENDRLLRDAWKTWNEEQKRKEETKMEKLVLELWRKFVIGLRIRERVQDTYGNISTFDPSKEMTRGANKDEPIDVDSIESKDAATKHENDKGGGFLPEEPDNQDGGFGGGFLLPHEGDIAAPEELEMDEQISSQKDNGHLRTKQNTHDPAAAEYPTPVSAASRNNNTHKHSKSMVKSKRKSLLQVESDDDNNESPLSEPVSALDESMYDIDADGVDGVQKNGDWNESESDASSDDESDHQEDEYKPASASKSKLRGEKKIDLLSTVKDENHITNSTPNRKTPSRTPTANRSTRESRADKMETRKGKRTTPKRSNRSLKSTPVKSPYFDDEESD